MAEHEDSWEEIFEEVKALKAKLPKMEGAK